MELKINEIKLPENITFNYEELKQELTEKISMYETMVYTDAQIKDAKADKANLNKLKKALNDERIKREKEYMQPFNDFKAKVNEIISIIDKPVAVIDKQVKEFENKQKEEKRTAIQDYWNSLDDENTAWLPLTTIFNEKWLNSSVSMKSIQADIQEVLEHTKAHIDALQNLPEYSFEAIETYKTTLDINKALNEAHRLAEIAKKKAEMEAQAKEKEEKVVVGTVTATINVDGQPTPIEEIAVEAPVKQWIGFKALLSEADAIALNVFFKSRNIEFEAI